MTNAVCGGRVSLIDALEAEVERARASGHRLSAAIARADGGEERPLEVVLLELAASPLYAVRSGSYAIILPGLGRAEALGVLAKAEARCGARGTAVELAPDESADELAVRLLASVGSVPVPEGD